MSDKRLGTVPRSLRGVSCPCCGSVWMVHIEQSLSLVPDLEAMREKRREAEEEE